MENSSSLGLFNRWLAKFQLNGMQVYLCVLSKACPKLSNGDTQHYKFTLTASKQRSVSWELGAWSS